MRAFPKEISICLSRLSKEICPQQCWQPYSNLLKAHWNKKRWRKGSHAVSSWAGTSFSISCPCTSESWFLGLCGLWVLSPSDLDWITSQVFLVLCPEDGRLWDFSGCITTCTNSHNKCPLMCIYVMYLICMYVSCYMYLYILCVYICLLLVLFLWRTLTNTMYFEVIMLSEISWI